VAGTGYAYASAQTVIQLGIETTKGTAATPKFAIPVKAPKYKVDLTVIEDETLQGTMALVYDQVPGMRYDSHGWDGYPYLDLFPALVRCEFGSTDTLTTAATSTTLATAAAVGATTIKTTATLAAGDFVTLGSGATLETHQVKSVSGTATPFTATLVYPLIYAHATGGTVTGLTGHAFSLLNTAGTGNQPPSATIYDYDGEECRELTAAQMDELTIKGNATGLVTYTCSWFANPATKVTQPTPSFSGVEAPPGWTFTGSVDGTVLDTIQTWELSFKRGVKPIPGLTGSQEYFEYFAGPLQATGKLTFLEQSGSPQLAEFIAGTVGAYDFTFYDTRTGYIFNAHSTKAAFKTGDLDRSKEWVEVSLTVQLLPSATDSTAGGGGRSPVKVSIGNATTSKY
jgi:hypothetical protein